MILEIHSFNSIPQRGRESRGKELCFILRCEDFLSFLTEKAGTEIFI